MSSKPRLSEGDPCRARPPVQVSAAVMLFVAATSLAAAQGLRLSEEQSSAGKSVVAEPAEGAPPVAVPAAAGGLEEVPAATFGGEVSTVSVGSAVAVFDGTVVAPDGSPLPGALVEIGTRKAQTDASGHFRVEAPIAARYVLNISKPGEGSTAYAPLAQVYTTEIQSGRWVLSAARVVDVDPHKPIVLTHERSADDCRRSPAAMLDWSAWLDPKLFEWQDGRGGTTAQPDAALLRATLPLLGHFDARLPSLLAGTSGDTGTIPAASTRCGPGIAIEMAPDSLVQAGGRKPVEVGVTASVATWHPLTGAALQGDPPVAGRQARAIGFESLGAGSIEFDAGPMRLNLKPGKFATVSIPVDPTLVGRPEALPRTAAFMFYDSHSGRWNQEGVARLVDRGGEKRYVAKVRHLSVMSVGVLRPGPACLAVEVDRDKPLPLPIDVEVLIQGSKTAPSIPQARRITIDASGSGVLYNLPANVSVALVPVQRGTAAGGERANVPLGVFVVDSGAAQRAPGFPPQANLDGSFYAERNGKPTGPCNARVVLRQLDNYRPEGPQNNGFGSIDRWAGGPS